MSNQYEQLPELSAKHNEVHRGAYSSSAGSFVDRGDPAVVDYDQTSLTSDGNYHDLDLSVIVPAGAKAVLLAVYYKHATPGSYIRLRKNGYTNANNAATLVAQVNGVFAIGDFIISCDENRFIEYACTAGTVETDIIVKGWFI
jgi:hypothetical protein